MPPFCCALAAARARREVVNGGGAARVMEQETQFTEVVSLVKQIDLSAQQANLTGVHAPVGCAQSAASQPSATATHALAI